MIEAIVITVIAAVLVGRLQQMSAAGSSGTLAGTGSQSLSSPSAGGSGAVQAVPPWQYLDYSVVSPMGGAYNLQNPIAQSASGGAAGGASGASTPSTGTTGTAGSTSGGGGGVGGGGYGAGTGGGIHGGLLA